MKLIDSYINDLEHFFKGKNFWQASLLRQLEGLTFQQALFKPSPERHCIWEIVSHVSYWKHWVITFVKKNVKLDAKLENWKPLPKELNEKTWESEIHNLKTLHDDCEKLAKGIGDNLYTSKAEKIIFFRQHIYHDCYHSGQIGLLRVMQGLKPVE